MLGTEVRVHPLFWVSSALVGVIYYQDPEHGGVEVFVFWMVAVFVSILLHEFGHAFAARLFGVRGRIVLSALGGRWLGLEDLTKCWQRLAVCIAGPVTSFLVFGVLWAIPWIPFPPFLKERGLAAPLVTGMWILMWGNLYWGLLNLLPLWPLDGGQIAREIAAKLLGARGLPLATLLSVVTAGLLTIWVLLEMRVRLIDRFDPRYPLHLMYFGILLLYCFAYWTVGFRAFWSEETASSTQNAESGRAA
jgi:Zn-dependent protease